MKRVGVGDVVQGRMLYQPLLFCFSNAMLCSVCQKKSQILYYEKNVRPGLTPAFFTQNFPKRDAFFNPPLHPGIVGMRAHWSTDYGMPLHEYTPPPPPPRSTQRRLKDKCTGSPLALIIGSAFAIRKLLRKYNREGYADPYTYP